MYILFNSAFKFAYLENVFKIITCPVSSKITMRYSAKNLAEDFNSNKLLKQKCLIIFIDRFNPGKYKYIALRYGKIISVQDEKYKEEKKYFITLKLDNYCHINNNKDLFEKIKNKNPNCPQLKNFDPENINDGQYIINFDESELKNILSSNKESWSNVTMELSNAKLFKDNDLVYLKTEILDTNNKQAVICKSGETYNLQLTYYNPKEKMHEVELEFFKPLLKPGPSKILTGCGMDKVNLPFVIDKVYLNNWTFITINEKSFFTPISFEIKLGSVFLNIPNIMISLIFFAIIFFHNFDLIPKFSLDNKIIDTLAEIAKWIFGLILFIRFGKPIA